MCWIWLSSSWSSFINECEGHKYENRSRCDAREGLVDVGWLRYPYVTFYIMPVCHLQNFHLHWQFQIWFKISKYFHVEFCYSTQSLHNCVASVTSLWSNMLPGALTITHGVQQKEFNFYILLNLVQNRNVKDNNELSFIILWNQYENMPFYKVKKNSLKNRIKFYWFNFKIFAQHW